MMTILVFILVLGILIFVHELGHFMVAKWAGVRVEKFSLGFGPAIFKKRWGETEYQIACIPLGGFVKMSGEDPSEELEEEKAKKEEEEETAEKEPELPPVPPERMFNHQPVLKRMAIVIAGPAMNLVLAFILVPIVYMMGIEVDATLFEKPVIGYVDSEGPAGEAGFQSGDLILSIDGKEMPNWKKAKTYILFHPNRELSIEFERKGRVQTKMVKTQTLASIGGGNLGIFPPWPSSIKNVLKDKPAQKAGLQPGDVIVQLDYLKDPHWFQTQQYIQKHPNVPLALVVKRGNKQVKMTITPEQHPELEELGFVGIEPEQPSTFRHFGFWTSVKMGVQENIENTVTTFIVVGKLIKGDLKIKAMGGPVQIAEFTGAAAEQGLTHLLIFMAFISLQLAILNLLPIPVLDGGHLAFMTVEIIKGSPLSIKKRLIAQQIGIALLLTLMVVVTFNDIARHKGSIFGFFKNLFN